jgi:hypothetical protein
MPRWFLCPDLYGSWGIISIHHLHSFYFLARQGKQHLMDQFSRHKIQPDREFIEAVGGVIPRIAEDDTPVRGTADAADATSVPTVSRLNAMRLF